MSHFVEVILPLAIPNAFTYLLPQELIEKASVGKRVEVQFGRSKHYSGIIKSIFESEEDVALYKPVLNVLDLHPILTEQQLQFWNWVAQYYCSGIGEVMNTALPPGLKMNSQSILGLHPEFRQKSDTDIQTYPHEAIEIIGALKSQGEISLDMVRKILAKKNITATINYMLDKEIVILKEELTEEYKIKKEIFVQLTFTPSNQEAVKYAFKLTGKSEKQTNVLLAMMQESKKSDWVKRLDIIKATLTDSSVFNLLEKKGLVLQREMETNRLKNLEEDTIFYQPPSAIQSKIIEEIHNLPNEKPVLLHGVTGSGKTRVFIHLIERIIENGGQVLYLVPEITLATQLVERIKKKFGSQLHPYHSRLPSAQKVDIWKAVSQGFPLILGARSSVFLPFTNLQLIIVDEEHDESYKQNFTSPRFNARDAAIVLSRFTGAKIVLGSATPSLESYYNAKNDKYHYFKLDKRIENFNPPQVKILDIKRSERIKRHKFQLAEETMEKIREALQAKKQSLIFINRRGFAPLFECDTCAWTQKCNNCDVTLTYHKFTNQLHCHLCGNKEYLPKRCPSCGNHTFDIQGAGTQRIEDELNIFFPEANVERLDMDNARSPKNLLSILKRVENKEIDILVGTKMISKGLDFDNLSFAVVVNADSLFSFPDFRSHESALQQLIQISGRVGRKTQESHFYIQTSKPDFELFQLLDWNNQKVFYTEELKKRKELNYPPYFRLIKITLKHKNDQLAQNAADYFADGLKRILKTEVLGPSNPMISRVRNYYLKDILIKLPNNAGLITKTKKALIKSIQNMEGHQDMRGLKFVLDIDPL